MASQSQAIDNTPVVEEPTHAPPILVDLLLSYAVKNSAIVRRCTTVTVVKRTESMVGGKRMAQTLIGMAWTTVFSALWMVWSLISPTAILGPDGRKTVAIVVDYAWYPTFDERDELISVLKEHGWVGMKEGAFFEVIESIDAIAVDKVPVSALMDIYHLEGVVVVEMQNVMVPFNDVAARAALARSSEDYSNTGHIWDILVRVLSSQSSIQVSITSIVH